MTDKDWKKGYIQLYTGNGKGKTTAAMGLMLRAVGAGLPIYFAQFIKGMDYSELKSIERFSDCVSFQRFGTEKWICTGEELPEEDLKNISDGLSIAETAMLSGKYRVIILDELLTACMLELFTENQILEFIDKKPENVELILTGRGATETLIEKADLVTEMKDIKHYYADGVKARKGIES